MALSSNALISSYVSVAPANNAQGQLVGLQLTEPPTTLTVACTVRRSRSQTLVNINDATSLDFTGITTCQFVIVNCSVPSRIDAQYTGLGVLTHFTQLLVYAVPLVSNNMTALAVTALATNTVVDIAWGGI